MVDFAFREWGGRERDRGSTTQGDITFREAAEQDIVGIAALHADSWRRHYRGAYRDAFLDGPVVEDRRAVWAERLAERRADQITVVADRAGEVVGFVHMILDENPQWGALLDNLHVTHRLKRRGIGRQLLAETAHRLVRHRPVDSRFYLWVLDQNAVAQAFYAALGGTTVETTLSEPFPGGGRARCRRIAWPDVAALESRLARET